VERHVSDKFRQYITANTFTSYSADMLTSRNFLDECRHLGVSTQTLCLFICLKEVLVDKFFGLLDL